MQTTSYIAAEDIEQGDLLSFSSATSLAVLLKRADSGEAIIARAAQDCKTGSPIQVTLLDSGTTTTVICGDTIVAGAHIDGSDGKAVTGTSSIVAIDSGSSGDRIRVVKTASDNSPGTADKALALDTGGQYVGGPDTHMYFFNNGKPVRSSASVGSATVPMYMSGGQFKACSLSPGLTLESLFATDENGIPAVGSIGLYELYVGDGQNHYYGEEITLTHATAKDAKNSGGNGATCCGPLHINTGELSDKVTWIQQSGRKSLPVNAKIRILTSMDANAGIVLAIRTA